ncbi:MAG: hypothetical protein LBB24_03825 [Rickettsiales bacterium]|nr:hypothetical protein [Rickettsiales bacterium]
MELCDEKIVFVNIGIISFSMEIGSVVRRNWLEVDEKCRSYLFYPSDAGFVAREDGEEARVSGRTSPKKSLFGTSRR